MFCASNPGVSSFSEKLIRKSHRSSEKRKSGENDGGWDGCEEGSYRVSRSPSPLEAGTKLYDGLLSQSLL